MKRTKINKKRPAWPILKKTFANSFTLKFTQQHVCPGQILSYLVLFIRAKFCRIRVKFWLIYVLLCFHKILFCIFHVLYLKRPKLNQKEIVVVPFLFKKINVAHSDRRTHSTLLYLLSLYLGITASHAVWPNWAIYWTLSNFSKPLATINLPKISYILRQFL